MSIDTIMRGLDGIERKLHQLPELSDRLSQLEQRATCKPGDMFASGRKTLGALVAEQFKQHGDMFAKSGRLRLEIKAATDLISTTSAGNTLTGGVGAVPVSNKIGLQYALSRRPAPGVTAMEYSRMTAVEGAAAQQAAEGDLKAYVRPTHSIITQASMTIAGLTVMSKQSVMDSMQLQKAVDTTLMRSCDVALDALLCSGGTGFTGYEALATAYTSLLYTNMADAVSEGQATMQQAGFNPDTVVLTPASWLALSVAKGTANDHYLSGNYLGAMPLELRGLRVVLSADLVAGKALLIDSAHLELLDVDQFVVEMGTVDDDFARNKVTLRGELRVLPVFLTTGSARLITPKA